MLKKLLAIFFVLTCLFMVGTHKVRAGFGISPPYVKNNAIVPGSHYEQRIVLLRSSAEDDLLAEIKVNAPEVEKWITIDKGLRFPLPKGELQVPMVVNVDVPKDAELGNYKGYINIRIAPKDENQKGGVAIALGARVDIDLTLTNVTFANFIVRLASIPDVEMLGRPWNWKYIHPLYKRLFYRVKAVLNIENTGNVEVAPSKITLDIFDILEKNKLESLEDDDIKKVKAYSTELVSAEFPTKLDAGQYWGKVRVYKDNETIVNSYKIAFTITPPGGSGNPPELGVWPWLVLAGLIIAALAVIAVLVRIRAWKYGLALFNVLLVRPLLWPLWRKLASAAQGLKLRFWKWIRNKAEKYEE